MQLPELWRERGKDSTFMNTTNYALEQKDLKNLLFPSWISVPTCPQTVVILPHLSVIFRIFKGNSPSKQFSPHRPTSEPNLQVRGNFTRWEHRWATEKQGQQVVAWEAVNDLYDNSAQQHSEKETRNERPCLGSQGPASGLCSLNTYSCILGGAWSLFNHHHDFSALLLVC